MKNESSSVMDDIIQRDDLSTYNHDSDDLLMIQNVDKYVKVAPGVNLFVKDCGEGVPVVLIHGWPLSSDMWEYQVDALVKSGHRVIAYDRRGFGKSSKPWNGYDYDTMADDLSEVIDQLGLDNVTLVGFSMGGGEVARYFTRYGGEKIRKAVLISSVTPYMLKTADNADGTPQEKFNEMAENMQDDRIGFLDDFGKTFFGINLVNHPVSTPLLNYYTMLCSLASPHATVKCAQAFATTDFRPDMQNINVPTLIIHGGSDNTVPIEAAGDNAAKMIKDNQYLVYEGAPHGLFYTEKERLNDDLVSFIGRR